MKLGLIAALLAINPSVPTAAPLLPSSGKFVYSNACLSPGGDFAGYRVRLSRGSKSLQATVEFNDDGPDGSDVARNLEFNPDSGALSFSFRGSVDADQYTFHGIVSMEQLVGSFDVKLAGQRDSSRGPLQTMPAVKMTPKFLPACDPRFPP